MQCAPPPSVTCSLFKMADELLEADIACLDHYDYFFRPDLLSGKVAFITGGGSGIGFTITEVFMRYVAEWCSKGAFVQTPGLGPKF